jgi:hypothetical protein
MLRCGIKEGMIADVVCRKRNIAVRNHSSRPRSVAEDVVRKLMRLLIQLIPSRSA